ncbi:MAG: biotin--[acetyl-CoA-carboxylase] ligase [Candidatus Heimdallarchaeota archaeon]|nr:biotin--[acetyl-CoA-carboxylase] ligase [Candidatus Heimdallarchaeota archaeon]MCK4254184.1 biotin--[acetyl-CoA-carboxylase] ligase [Candidatus Heimdallarchaeota archaeon]
MVFKTLVKNIIHFSTVNSTMDEALSFVKEGLDHPFLIVADEQRIGKGRGENIWSSPKGGFYGTYAIPLEKQITEQQILFMHYAAAIAVQQVLEKETGLEIKTKWPNDIYFRNKKLGGIIIEYLSRDKLFLLIGIGVNLFSNIDDIAEEYRSKSITLQFEDKQDLAMDKFTSKLSDTLLKFAEEIFENSFSNIINLFNSRLNSFKKELKLKNGDQYFCQGINDTGELILENESDNLQLTIEDSQMILEMN